MSNLLLTDAQRGILAQKGGRLSDSQVAHLMALSPSQVHIDTALSNFLIMYENREYIADMVSPVVTVSKRSDKIFSFPDTTMQAMANVALAGNRGRPAEATYTITNTSYVLSDYGLIDFVSADEESNADAPLQPRLLSAQVLMNFLMLAREYRVSLLLQATSQYGANVTTLTGSNRWDTPTGTPVQNILDAIEAPLAQPNVLLMGGQVWQKFRNQTETKSFIISRPSTNQGPTPFMMDEETVARGFGLVKVAVGRARYNSAAEGLTAVSSYVWPKFAALIRVEQQPNARQTQTMSYTFRYGPIVNQVIPELLNGVRGGVYVKITHSDGEYVLGGADTGYIYATPVS